jgi:glutaredoxin
MTITVYTKTGCSWCADVINYLDENGILYEEKNVSENPDFMFELENKTGQTFAPTFEIDGKLYPNSDVEELKSILES